ncbi:MAG: TonB-dependent receptor [Rhodospirillaceae bacterium]|nr:TonB-dependent receptor [Rhodospirillaceae bacterium]
MESFAQQSAQGGLMLEEIVVTARKRDESIFEIPVAVSAMTKDMLERAGVDNPQDLSDFVSGLDFQPYDFGGRNTPNIRIRGMIQQIITPSTQVGALFWDGSYVGGGGGFLPIGDLERVEVIKGPQTAYFGRNTFSGAVNYIPRMPTDEWEGNVSAGYSPTNHDEMNASAAIGGPVSPRVGIRFAAAYDRDGGDYSFDDGEPFAQFRDKSVSGTVTYNPTDEIRVKATGYYVTSEDTTTGTSLRATVPAGQCNKVVSGQYLNVATGVRTPFTRDLRTLTIASFCGRFPEGDNLEFPITRFPTSTSQIFAVGAPAVAEANRVAQLQGLMRLNPRSEKYGIIRTPQGGLGGWHQTYRIQMSGEFDFADHTLTVTASRANTGTTTRTDQFFGITGSTRGDEIQIVGTEIYQREFYYEARISSPQDQRLRYLVGVSDYNQHYGAFTDFARPSPVDRQINKTFGAFASIDYDILDNLTLSVEGRYTDESSEAVEFGDPRLACGLVLICNQKNSYDDVIPRVILTYKPADGITTYASYSYSSLLGLATQARFINSLAPDIIPASALAAIGDFTAPQENTQYEIGWKQQGDNYNFTFATFYIDWKNQPFAAVIFLPGGAGTSSFRGPGDSEYMGFDLEGSWQANEWLNLNMQLGYSDAEMKSFSSRGSEEQFVLGSGALSVVADGNPVRNHPEWTGSFSPTITGSVGDRNWFVRGDVIYTSKAWTDYSRLNINPDATRVNLRAGIDVTPMVQFEVYGTNIFNDLSIPTTGGTTIGPNNDRKLFTGVIHKRDIGIKVNARF